LKLATDIKNALSSLRKRSEDNVKGRYYKYLYKKFLFFFVCLVIVVVIAGVSMTLGSYDMTFFDVYDIIFTHLFNWNAPETVMSYIVLDLRLPRVVMGIIAGVGLAIAGASMQGIMKNPLADPYTTGISTGAGFGAALAIIMGIGAWLGDFAIVINAFIFALIPMLVIMALSQFRKASPSMMILAGIATMYIFSAMTTLMMISADADDLQAVYMWTVGTLDKATWSTIPIVFAVVVAGSIFLQMKAKDLNVISAGDAGAKSLGVNVERTRKTTLLCISLMTAAIVSFTGVIGFIGMVSPHVVRMFMGSDHKYLIPASGMFGAALLLGADGIARTVVSPTILPVGVITAFIGGPLFLYLIMFRKKEIW
jgi:iron complex transport system permease protein